MVQSQVSTDLENKKLQNWELFETHVEPGIIPVVALEEGSSRKDWSGADNSAKASHLPAEFSIS